MTKTLTGNSPQSFQGFQISTVGAADSKTGQRLLILSNGQQVRLSQLQASIVMPVVGDYYIVPKEGYPYCMPKATMLQNYTVSS